MSLSSPAPLHLQQGSVTTTPTVAAQRPHQLASRTKWPVAFQPPRSSTADTYDGFSLGTSEHTQMARAASAGTSTGPVQARYLSDPDWRHVYDMATRPNAYYEWILLNNALYSPHSSSGPKPASVLRAEIAIIAERERLFTSTGKIPKRIYVTQPAGTSNADWRKAKENVKSRRRTARGRFRKRPNAQGGV